MVRSVGIDPGEDTAKVVELDGTYRKTRLLRVHAAPVAIPASDIQGRAEAVAAIAREAIDTGMKGEPLLGHPCREAVLRALELPFKGHDQIRKVVKAEAETEIHGYAVDDMVVDFHEIGEGSSGGTRLLVAAVPKLGLRAQLDALAANSIEPEHIDLDTMALWRAAHWAGAFAADDAASLPVAAGTSVVTAVVEIGARTVKVLLVEGDNLVDMRVIRVGDAAVGDAIASRHGIDAHRAHEFAIECLQGGADIEFAIDDDLPVAADGDAAADADAAPASRQILVSFRETEAAHTAYLQRLARELMRYLTSVPKAAAIRAVWTTGMGIRAPGVHEMLSEVFGVEPQALDVLANLQHDLDDEEAERLGPQLATAIGLALSKLGGPAGFDLRQEDLVVQRGFERIKFPLAIACMVALLALVFYSAKLSAELRNLELQIGKTYIDPKKPDGPPQFHGMLHSVLSGRWFENGSQFRIEETKGKDYTYKDLVEELSKVDVSKRLLLVRDKLRLVADQKQKDSGIYEDVSLESGLAVLVRFAQIMKAVEPQLGRYLLLRLSVNMKAPNRKLEFMVAFRGDDFRSRLEALQLALEADYELADSPFERPSTRAESSKEELFRDSAESGVSGAYYKITLKVKDLFQPFGPSGATR